MNGPVAPVKGLHHIGIPVRNLERSLAWYGELFGVTPVVTGEAGGPETSRTVGLEDVRLRFAFLHFDNTAVELLEYAQPAGRDFDLRNCDVGAIHLCLQVDDIEEVHRRLRDRGVEFSTEPRLLGGALEGNRICYFRDPDGIQLELWQLAPER
jgi:catechol 2,3-dioxygenase-like lactoylglutathione lyase family enzyme